MKRPNQEIERRFDTWLGTLLYHSAQDKVDTETFGQRLEGIIAPIVAPEAIHGVARQALQALAEMPSLETVSDLQGCTPEKMQQRIALMQELSVWRPISADRSLSHKHVV